MSTVHREPSPVHSGGQESRFRAGDPLYARAYALADAGGTQEAIAAALAEAFPGMPNERYYLNPAAIAVMSAYRIARQRAEGRRADLARLRAKGLPEALAGPSEEPVERPPWTDCADDPDWHGPLHTEVDRVRTAGELLALCARHDLAIRYDAETGEIVLNRRIATDSALYAKLKRLKPLLVDVLVALARAPGAYET